MQALLIVLCIFTCSIQNVFKKSYGEKFEKGEFTFSFLTSLFALIFFAVTSKSMDFSREIFLYSFFFAICYAIATVTMVFAMKIGNMTLTSLFISYSLIIPTLNGLFFLGDNVKIFQYIGIFALLVSIYLVRGEAKKTEEQKKISLKWIIYVILAFISNGMCSVIQNAQKIRFNGKYDGDFMIVSLAIVVIFFAVCILVYERKIFGKCFKNGMVLGSLNGISNGATNFLVMLSLSFVPSSVFFPLISAGGIIFTFFCSLLIYKERFILRQLIGLVFGVFALVFLNI